MGASVTFHDRIGPERLTVVVSPLSLEQAHAVLERAIAEALRTTLGPRLVEVELTLCADPEMSRLNFDHMGERGPTDVLSFPLHDWELEGPHAHLADDGPMAASGGLLLGDVVIDVDQATRQAVDGGWSPMEELALLAIHGALHLVGHDHAELEEERVMRTAERAALAALHRHYPEIAWQPGSLFDRAGHAVTTGS